TDRAAQLSVDSFSITIGAESIGLPTSRSFDTLLGSYLELVWRVRADEGDDLRADDIQVLAEATGVSPQVIENRLQRLAFA
ncbi:MAG: hypothetical protein OES57_02190, partial [Acidimicrobiia bacterium]|nr:hypothetical protein [Acidimicrobiia bacterium]